MNPGNFHSLRHAIPSQPVTASAIWLFDSEVLSGEDLLSSAMTERAAASR